MSHGPGREFFMSMAALGVTTSLLVEESGNIVYNLDRNPGGENVRQQFAAPAARRSLG